jgi:hexokinase
MNDFELTTEALIDVAIAFKEEVRAGLAQDNAQLKCLPAFIPFPKQLTDGYAYVLDLGGSNLRAAVVCFHEGKATFLKGPKKAAMPWKRNLPLPREVFLGVQADLLSSLEHGQTIPLGYCFSYPATSTINRDAVLLDWTKGTAVPDTLGRPVGHMLARHLAQHHRKVKISRITVINDTVASLFACLIKPPVDGAIGLIVGTGTNMAAFMDAAFIPKLSGLMDWKGQIAVNLESGNFTFPHLTRYDEMVDAASENRGVQRFEKAVSGLYLSRIFKALFPESALDPDSGAKRLIRLFSSGADQKTDQVLAAKHIYCRSARLTAAALAGLVCVLSEHRLIHRVRVVAEGALFNSRLDSQTKYSSIVDATCNRLLEQLGLAHIKIIFPRIKDANLVGTAIAALS